MTTSATVAWSTSTSGACAPRSRRTPRCPSTYSPSGAWATSWCPDVKLGIGARITALFGLGALILSILMGGLSYFTTRHFLLADRETAAQHQAFDNALLVRTSLEAGETHYVTLLASIDAGTDAHSVLYHQSKAYVSSLSVNASSIPRKLRKVVLGGNAATQTYR